MKKENQLKKREVRRKRLSRLTYTILFIFIFSTLVFSLLIPISAFDIALWSCGEQRYRESCCCGFDCSVSENCEDVYPECFSGETCYSTGYVCCGDPGCAGLTDSCGTPPDCCPGLYCDSSITQCIMCYDKDGDRGCDPNVPDSCCRGTNLTCLEEGATGTCTTCNATYECDPHTTGKICHTPRPRTWIWGTLPATETVCDDGFDNDCDGFVDLADSEDCALCGAVETVEGDVYVCGEDDGICPQEFEDPLGNSPVCSSDTGSLCYDPDCANLCAFYPGEWFNITGVTLPHASCADPYGNCVRDSNSNGYYDQYCKDGFIHSIEVILR